MDSDRSILNKSNIILNYTEHSLDNHTSHTSQKSPSNFTSTSSSSLDDTTLSHFRVKNTSSSSYSLLMSPFSETKEQAEEVEQPQVERRDVSYASPLRAQADLPYQSHHHHQPHNDNNKLMAMAEVISGPSYSQKPPPYYHSYHFHNYDSPVAIARQYHQHPQHQHHLPTPSTSTSPHEYTSPTDCIPSIATLVGGSASADIATPVEGPVEVFDDGVIEIDDNDKPHETTESNVTADNNVNVDNNTTTITTTNNYNNNNDSTENDNGNVDVDIEMEDAIFVPTCQYEAECKENPPPAEAHCRKTVSHIFGRNKTCTQLVPDHLWIWYCRKHYQRCRYRVVNWALQQVQIVRETLDNFEEWGNIESFNVTLRKREQDRTRNAPMGNNSSNGIASTAVSSSAGTGTGTGAVPTTNTDVQRSKRRIARPARLSANEEEKRVRKARMTSAAVTRRLTAAAAGVPESSIPISETMSEVPDVTSAGRRKTNPVNVPSPVPPGFYGFLGENKTFDDVRNFIAHIDGYIRNEHEAYNNEVSFPDIEILPNFTLDFMRSKNRATDQLSQHNHSRRRRARDVRTRRTRLSPVAVSVSIPVSASASHHRVSNVGVGVGAGSRRDGLYATSLAGGESDQQHQHQHQHQQQHHLLQPFHQLPSFPSPAQYLHPLPQPQPHPHPNSLPHSFPSPLPFPHSPRDNNLPAPMSMAMSMSMPMPMHTLTQQDSRGRGISLPSIHQMPLAYPGF